MAINITLIGEKLEKACQHENADFFFGFLEAFKFPNATINRLREPLGGAKNCALSPELGELAIKQSVYFKSCEPGSDLQSIAQEIAKREQSIKDKIRFVICTDFNEFYAWDTKYQDARDCEFKDVNRNVDFFLPLVKIERGISYEESTADVRASEKMGRLFDSIQSNNEFTTEAQIYDLNMFMARLLFCYFAEDTGIFSEKGLFTNTITQLSDTSGNGLSESFAEIFRVLNTPNDSQDRKNLSTIYSKFPYVNGGLFAEETTIPKMNGRIRRLIIECGQMEWSQINPDIFGSMFQAVVDPEHRHSHGQHYTSVTNIMRVIEPLFIGPLKEDLEKIKGIININSRIKALHNFKSRLGQIKVADFACGSGNFCIWTIKL